MSKTDWVILASIGVAVGSLMCLFSWDQSRYSSGSRTVSGHHLELVSKYRGYKHSSNLIFKDQDWLCQGVEARYVKGYPDEIRISVGDTLKINYTVTLGYKDKKPWYETFDIDKETLEPYYIGN